MKKRFAVLLSAALSVSAAFTVMAAEDMSGEWYANVYGVPVTMTLNEGGEYTLVMEVEGAEDDEPETGTWEFDGKALILDKGGEGEMSMEYDGELLSAESDGMELVFGRDPEAAKGFVPAELVADAKIEDFAGYWKGTQVSFYGMPAPLEMMDMEKLDLEIKDNLVTIDVAGGDFLGEWKLPDIESELKEGALTFIVPAEDEYSEDSEYKVRCHEDGTLSLSMNVMDEEFIVYMEAVEDPAKEPEEETAE